MANPRAARVAALIQRVIASAIGRLHDQRLREVTITEVRVTNDLQIATVYWTQLGEEQRADGQRARAKQALAQASGRLRSLVGAQVGLRLTPQLRFIYDEVPGQAHEIEDILVAARQRDEQLAQQRVGAQYAGEADPYRHDDEDVDELDADEASVDAAIDEAASEDAAETSADAANAADADAATSPRIDE